MKKRSGKRVSRNAAKAPRNPWKKAKLKIRNPKFETSSNDQKSENSKPARFGFELV
jgi:hypothetical protein